MIIVVSVSMLTWIMEEMPQHRDYRNICVAGISMGGQIATILAAHSPVPLHVVAIAPSHSALATWTDGCLAAVSNWDVLRGTPRTSDAQVERQLAEFLKKSDIRSLPLPFSWLPKDAMPRMVLVGAEHDAYIPPYSTQILASHWQRFAELRTVYGGHCSLIVGLKTVTRDLIGEVLGVK